jgi:beta-lactamase class A
MRSLLPALVFLSACTAVQRPNTGLPTPAATSTSRAALDSLRTRIATRIRALPGAEVAVWYRDLGNSDSLALDADLSFHAASTMKVPVMIELFRQADAGTLRLDQPLRIENRFTSIVDGSPFTLSANDDSDSTLYHRIGQEVPLRELNLRMITRSSNFATNLIIQLLDAPTITTHARALGARDIQVRRGVEDTKAFDAGLNNTTTAHDLGVLMAAIEQGRAGSAASTAAMKAVLLQQEFNDEIPAGLPAGTPVAHKTGSITATWHDAAIVYPKGRQSPYVLVVLTRKIPKEKDAQALIAAISREIYTFAMRRG